MAEGWNRVLDILSWKEPILSGLVFGCLNLAFYLLVFCDSSLLYILGYIALAHIGVVLVYQTINPQKFPDDEYEFISREVIEELISFGNNLIHKTLGKIYSLKSSEDLVQVLITLFIATFFSGIFSTTGFLWLATILGFSVPKLFKTNQTQVETQIEFIKTKFNDIKSQATSNIPRAKSCL